MTKPMGNIEKLLYEMSQKQATIVPITPDTVVSKPVPVAYNFDAIPQRLKDLPQWVCWRYVPKGAAWDKVPFDARTGANANSMDPTTWSSWDDVLKAAPHFDGIGFVLQKSNGLVIVDLDDKPSKPASQERRTLFNEIYRNLGTYSELSVSGRGMHVICEGTVPEASGKQFENIDIFDDKHYFTFTGNTNLSALSYLTETLEPVLTVENCQPELDYLLALLNAGKLSKQAYDGDIDVPQTKTHDEILEACWNQSNGETFQALWNGQWQDLHLGDGSQSPADMSFMEFLRNAGATMQQTIDIFKASKLYRPPPLKHARYPMRTVRRVFTIGAIEREGINAVKVQAQALLVQRVATHTPHEPHAKAAPLDWPPGTVGALAQLFYNQAPLPNKQIAIGTALGFMAGVCGLNWQTPKPHTGLNAYIVLVAPSGMGKEAAADLPATLYRDSLRYALGAQIENPFYSNTLGSAPALGKTLAHKRSMLYSWTEIGKLYRACNGPRADGNALALMDALTKLFPKSGMKSTMGGFVYSSAEKNVEDPGACALSILGDVTAAELFPNLSADSALDGALSRTDFIQVYGNRPLLNMEAGTTAPDAWLRWAGDLIARTSQLRNSSIDSEQFCFVQYGSQESANMLHEFQVKCTNAYNSMEEGFLKQSHTRGHLKALKYASLLAVADNPYSPAITTLHAQWAIEMVESVIAMFEQRVEEGDVGISDDSRENLVKRAISQYLPPNPAPKEVYGASAAMHSAGLVPLSYLSRKLGMYSAFRTHPLGKSKALRETMENLERCGVVHALEKSELAKLGVSLKTMLYRVLVAL